MKYKLYLFFKIDIKYIDTLNLDNDCLVISNGNYSNYKVHKCIDINSTFVNYKEKTKNWNRVFDDNIFNSESTEIRELFQSAAPNIFLHNYRFLQLWLETIRVVFLNYNISDIYFSHYIKTSYFPYYEAEGEVNKGLFYNRYDFIPSHIFNYLKENYSYNLVINNRKSNLLLFIRIISRRYLLFLLKFAIHLFNVFINSFFKKNYYSADFNKLIISRGLAHTHYIKKYFINNQDVSVLASNGLYTPHKNTKLLSRIDRRRIFNLYETLNIFDLFLVLTNTLILFFRLKNRFIEIEKIKINITSILIEVIIAQFEVNLVTKSVEKLVKNKSKKLIVFSCEMLTQYSFWLYKTIKTKENVKLFQLQTTSLELIHSPVFIFSDSFIFKSELDRNYFKEIFPEISNKMKYYGNLLIDNSFSNRKISKINNVIFFSQPYEKSNQLLILKYLYLLSLEYNFKVSIKLHPRENKRDIIKDFRNNRFKINVIQSDIDIEEIYRYSDLIITRTTSLIQDFIIKKVPSLVVLISDYDKSINYEFLKKDQINVVYDLKQIEEIIKNHEYFNTRYYSFCDEYYLKSGITLTYNDFVNQFND